MQHQPSYHKLLSSGELERRVMEAKKHFDKCLLCPHECQINRRNQLGFCRASHEAVVASYGPHFGEEPQLVGSHGSGTIFFGFCNLRCVYCQNYDLSFQGEGDLISNQKLGSIMLLLQEEYQCHNINLVTPTHFVPNILEALLFAARKGLKLPLVYNCGGYERVETLKLLKDIVDIYMPDFKYDFEDRGQEYSKVKNYPQLVKETLKEMDHQVGGLKTNSHGLAHKGLIIRHLVLPGGLEDTKKILKFIKEELSADCLVNLMDQYYPAHQAFKYKQIAKGLSSLEFKEAQAYAKNLGLRLLS